MNLEKFKQYADDFLIFLEVEKNSSPNTLRAYKADMRQLIEFWQRLLDKEPGIPHDFNNVVQRYVVALFYKKLQRSSLARKISCLRSLQQFLLGNGIKLKLNVKSPRVEKKLPKTVTVDEIFYLMDTIKPEQLPTSLPYRARAIFEMIYATGARCSEIVGMKLSNIDFDQKAVRVYGKGRKERIVLFGNKAHKAVSEYLNRERPGLDPHKKSDFLFLNHVGNKLTTRSIQRIFEMFRSFLKVDRELTPHKLRHSFATHLLHQGVGLRIIQEFLGHKTIGTTEIYTKVTNQELAQMCDEKHPLNNLDHMVLGTKK